MSGSQPPGWYPAPDSPSTMRWWDGLRWTGEVRETDGGGDAEAPAAEGEQGRAAQASSDGAAWRAPAVAAWQARTEPAAPRRRWLGRAKRQ
jgi:hypothetical protein